MILNHDRAGVNRHSTAKPRDEREHSAQQVVGCNDVGERFLPPGIDLTARRAYEETCAFRIAQQVAGCGDADRQQRNARSSR
jgi:hypothetical protein